MRQKDGITFKISNLSDKMTQSGNEKYTTTKKLSLGKIFDY